MQKVYASCTIGCSLAWLSFACCYDTHTQVLQLKFAGHKVPQVKGDMQSNKNWHYSFVSIDNKTQIAMLLLAYRAK